MKSQQTTLASKNDAIKLDDVVFDAINPSDPESAPKWKVVLYDAKVDDGRTYYELTEDK